MANEQTFQWHGNRDDLVFNGDVDLTATPATATLHGVGANVDPVTALDFAAVGAEIVSGSYTPQVIAHPIVSKLSSVDGVLTADDTVFAGLTATGVAYVVWHLADGRVLGHMDVVDVLTGTTPLSPSGGGLTFTWNVAVAPPPPPPSYTNVATSLSDVLGWGYNPPLSPANTQLRSALFGQTKSKALHAFIHEGLTSPFSRHEAVLRDALGLNSGQTLRTNGRDETLYCTIPPLLKADKDAGQTQASINQTLQSLKDGVNDPHFQKVVAIVLEFIAKVGGSYLLPSGRNRLAGQLGQEHNLKGFPWFLIDPALHAAAMDHVLQVMITAGLDISALGMPFFYNLNAIGNVSWQQCVDGWPSKATGGSIDVYAIDVGSRFWGARGTTATTNIVSGKGNERDLTAAVMKLRIGDPDPKKDTSTQTTMWKVFRECQRRGILFGVDELGVATTSIPPSDQYQWGSGDDPLAMELVAAAIDAMIPSGLVFQVSYFDYDVKATGLNHALTGSTAHTAAKAKMIALYS